MDADEPAAAPRARGGRRKGSGKRAEADAPWEFRAVQALADPSRWQIVRLLAIHEDSITEIAHRVGLSIATTSRHVSILFEAEIVEARRSGRTTRCRLAPAGSRAAALLGVLGVERLDGLVSGPNPRESRESAAVPEFEPARNATKRRYQSKDMDDFLL